MKTCTNKRDGARLNVSDLQYGSWIRAPVVTPNQERGLRRNGVELVASGARVSEGNRDSQSRSRAEREQYGNVGKEKAGEEELMATSPMERKGHKIVREGMGRLKRWRVAFRLTRKGRAVGWRCCGGKVLVSRFNTTLNFISIRLQRWMMMRWSGSLVFYGQTIPSLRKQAWDMLSRVKSKAEEQDLKDIITSIWSKEDCNMLEKMDLTRDKLGPWQYHHFKRLKYKIRGLEKEIGKLMDGSSNEWTMSRLKQARGKLGHLYDVEEKYWMLRALCHWLREGDRNTRYFYVLASGRRRKNSITRLKNAQGNWHENEEEIGHIAWNYFKDLFETLINFDVDRDLQYIPSCIDEETNRRLMDVFTDEEIVRAFS
ncbi:hypothetical protein GOBAR_AA11936 [Gossypium barbadense]|uniref:Uncharacterized protein n=1 Tax=Gossypium barbadense TaxID=3634 RepID=A0A2P5XZE8_GOSBA|nr:hypothetical protein GOBAR_AA11936 [Gossypium barbadense]